MEIAGASFHLNSALRTAYGLPAQIDAESLLQRLLDAATWRIKPIAQREVQAEARAPVEVEAVATRAIGRTRIMDLFAAARQGAASLTREFIDEANERLKSYTYIEIPAEGAAPQFRVHVHIDDMDSFFALIALLLATPEGRAMIGQCKQCRTFFFVPGRRDGQRDYCSSACRDARHDGADRKRQQRAVGVLLKKFGRERSSEAVKQAVKQYPEERSSIKLADHAQAILKGARKKK